MSKRPTFGYAARRGKGMYESGRLTQTGFRSKSTVGVSDEISRTAEFVLQALATEALQIQMAPREYIPTTDI